MSDASSEPVVVVSASTVEGDDANGGSEPQQVAVTTPIQQQATLVDGWITDTLNLVARLHSDGGFTLSPGDIGLMVRLFDLTDGMTLYKDTLVNDISTGPESRRTAILALLAKAKPRSDERKQIKQLLAHAMGKLVLLFFMGQPSSLEHRQAIVHYIRGNSSKYRDLQVEKHEVTIYIEDAVKAIIKYKETHPGTSVVNNGAKQKKTNGFIRPPVKFLEEADLEFHILVSWALCGDNTDSPQWISSDFRKVMNTCKMSNSEYLYYPWVQLSRCLENKLTAAIKKFNGELERKGSVLTPPSSVSQSDDREQMDLEELRQKAEQYVALQGEQQGATGAAVAAGTEDRAGSGDGTDTDDDEQRGSNHETDPTESSEDDEENGDVDRHLQPSTISSDARRLSNGSSTTDKEDDGDDDDNSVIPEQVVTQAGFQTFEVYSTVQYKRRAVQAPVQTNEPVSTKRARLQGQNYVHQHAGWIIEDTLDGHKCKMLFFPLHLVDMVSPSQEEKYNFIEHKLKPKHVTMIIGTTAQLQLMTCMIMRTSTIFRNLQSFAYMVPSNFQVITKHDQMEIDNQRKSKDAIAAEQATKLREQLEVDLCCDYSYTFDIKYNGNDIRTITVISKIALPNKLEIQAAIDKGRPQLEKIKTAMSKTYHVPGGSHSTCDDGILTLASLFRLGPGDIVWDIGVGKPVMAMYFSHLTNQVVVGTDTDSEVAEFYRGKYNANRGNIKTFFRVQGGSSNSQ